MRVFQLGLVICVILGSLTAFPHTCRAVQQDINFWSEWDFDRTPDTLLDEILARKEFKDALEPTLMDKAREMAYEALRRVIRWLAKRWPSGPRIGNEVGFLYFVLDILILSLVVLLTLFIAHILIRRMREGSLFPKRDDKLEIDANLPLPSTRKLWDIALKAAEQGDYAGALIILFRAVLVHLDQRGLLSYHSVKTNREILSSVASHADLRQLLSEMIPMFNSVFYGDAECDKPKYERFRALYEQAIERI
jgi:hypothetical protein